MRIIGNLIDLIVQIIVGILLISFTDDIRWLFFYLLVTSYINTAYWGNYTNKLIKVNQHANEINTISIIRKLKISKEEVQKVVSEIENNLTKSQLQSLIKDRNDTIL
jgi:hypothetical protein